MSQIQGGANDLAGLDAFDLNQDFGGGGDEYGGGFEHDFQFDLDLPGGAEGEAAEGEDAPATPSKKRKLDKGKERASTEDLLATPARSVLSVLARDELPTYHSEGPLAVFDDVSANAAAPSTAGTQSQLESQVTGASQSLGTEQEAAIAGAESVVTQKSGSISLQSKNTRKAVRVLQEQVGEDKTKPVEFEKVANKVSIFLSLEDYVSRNVKIAPVAPVLTVLLCFCRPRDEPPLPSSLSSSCCLRRTSSN